MKFELTSDYRPAGDQPEAIERLVTGLKAGFKNQTLLGVTGSGKTFTIANVIAQVQRPTLVISHNKTLAVQLYQEFREFFPKNAVCYFVSYYDYYQPEAYLPSTDTYIEKETEINEEIDRLRLAATTALSTRNDVIVVASVSAIYNLGSPREYQEARLVLEEKQRWERRNLLMAFSKLQYERDDYDFKRGTYRLRGESLEIYPAYENEAIRIIFADQIIVKLETIHPVTAGVLKNQKSVVLYPAKHYMASDEATHGALESIEKELKDRLAYLESNGKMIEAHRLRERTNYDLEMIRAVGYCKGIENYSSHFDGRAAGEPPFTLLDHFPGNFLLVIDESHMTIPQLNSMFNGDRARKKILVEFGFRLPSAFDNRPLKFGEFTQKTNQMIATSATPAAYELSLSNQIVEQLVRPTSLVDPEIKIKPTEKQIDDLIVEIKKRIKKKQRVLVTTLTKRMAEELANFLKEKNIRVHYLHSEIQTLDRGDILDDLRLGNYDVLVGINLLREGLDLPEVSLVVILDADKEGFLRSETALIQTMGRAARHIEGQIILYADTITLSIKKAIEEVERRREIQMAFNKKFRLIPKTINKPIREKIVVKEEAPKRQQGQFFDQVIEQTLKRAQEGSLLSPDRQKFVKVLAREMREAARILDFERAAFLRDRITLLNKH